MAERFENFENTLRDWAKETIQKKSCRCIEQLLEVGRRKIAISFSGNDSQKYSSGLSRQSSELWNLCKSVHFQGTYFDFIIAQFVIYTLIFYLSKKVIFKLSVCRLFFGRLKTKTIAILFTCQI